MSETKRVAKATVNANVEGLSLEFVFSNGTKATIGLGELSPEIVRRLALHGLEQKVRDSYAGSDTAGEAEGLGTKTMENLRNGIFNAKRESNGESVDTIGLLVEAVTAALTKAGKAVPENIGTIIRGADKAVRAKYRAMPPVALALAEIKAARAKDAAPKTDELGLFA